MKHAASTAKVRHEHIASLGSIVAAPGHRDRIAFWSALHGRLGKLSNRISPETLGKILGDIHARVPMVTPDEQRACSSRTPGPTPNS